LSHIHVIGVLILRLNNFMVSLVNYFTIDQRNERKKVTKSYAVYSFNTVRG